MAGIAPYLVLMLSDMSLHQAPESNFPGATLCFPRSLWLERPFRPLTTNEDVTFYLDHRQLGAELVRVGDPELFVAVRHGGRGGDRGHSWVKQGAATNVDEMLMSRPSHGRPLEAVMPAWALDHYRAVLAEQLTKELWNG